MIYMPERVTKEERVISMTIEKAKEVKEILHQSLTDNNRLPSEDKNEAVKVKRPKAKEEENVPESQKEGTNVGYGQAGDTYEF
tara:strand:- start:4012 stop:4260 length:249 start_codon:yes stop_codon:yes gene_type:complete